MNCGIAHYTTVIKKTASNCSAYVPDLPGCVTTGATIAEVEQGIRETIDLYLAGLREDGHPVRSHRAWSNTYKLYVYRPNPHYV